ncbi:alpha/beta hydrolase [Niabella sp. CC-SYL272]|uniref:alpha/beta hydrolase family protein n=1 Tax=Niabella agricola TaxID=2891571 RepID=UPI001F3D8D54|nr:alpha/beta fold hydrolase [Niabella agricola]MCF3109716.1 alpha/beta hydrolase [Niabella agricola]
MKYLFFFLTGLCPAWLFAQSVTGNWQGNLNLPNGILLPLVFHIEQSADSLRSTMDSPAQGAKGIPVGHTHFTNDTLQFEAHSLNIQYTGKLQNDSITGTFTQSGHAFPLVLKKSKDGNKPFYNRPQEPKPPFAYYSEDLYFKNEEQGNQLAGTLTTPEHKKDCPVVVLITGSGAQDRNEELFGHKPFLVIADYFARHGIGTLRLDDRGIGGSEKGKDGATSADFATDISSAVNYLAARGFRQIGLVGHSEGGMIAPITATKNKKVQFIISMAGPGIPIDSLMLSQLKASFKGLKNVSETDLNTSIRLAQKAYAVAKLYTGIHLKADLTDTLLQHFPQAPDMARAMAQTVSMPWFTYFIKFNPQDYIRQLKIPVLAINGSLDVQVDASENLAGWKTGLEKAGNRRTAIKELEGLNHLFQQAVTGTVAEYAQIEQTMAPEVLELMTGWILKNTVIKH